ncbi:MAG: hypothetical protein AAFN77_06250 [Planctomycetota bacterium]
MRTSFISWGILGLATVLLSQFFVQTVAAQIREYQRPLFGEIGYAHVDRAGRPYIVMNPRKCRRMGPELCNFFRNHEYAHHQLGHFHRNITVRQAEAEADRWAAMNSSRASVLAAQRYFASGRGASRLHGTSQQRLVRVGGGYRVFR